MKRTWLAAFAAIVCAFVWTPISAAAMSTSHYFGPYEIHFSSDVDCGFLVQFDISGEFHEVDFFDSAGSLTKSIVTQGHGAITLTASANGTTIGGTPPQNYVYIVTYNADGTIDTQSNDGIFVHLTVPGHGNVLVQVGRFVLDGYGNLIFEAGPDQDFSGDTAEFCAAFG
jgi:hypothetical protein